MSGRSAPRAGEGMGGGCSDRRCRLRLGDGGEAGTDAYGGLDTAQKGRGVDDDLELAPLFRGALCCRRRRVLLGLPLAEDLPDLLACCARLVPSGVSERRVVGSRGL